MKGFERPSEFVNKNTEPCIRCKIVVPKKGLICSFSCKKELTFEFISKNCASCGTESFVIKRSTNKLDGWLCYHCKRRKTFVYDSVNRCEKCNNRIVFASNENHPLYKENNFCFKCTFFGLLKEFKIPDLKSSNVRTFIQYLFNLNDSGTFLEKFNSHLELMNELFLDTDLVNSIYIFLKKPADNNVQSFSSFLLDIIYIGEGKMEKRKYKSLYNSYIGLNDYLEDKILKTFSEREGFYILEFNLKSSKPLVTCLEKGSIFFVKCLGSNSLANISLGNLKCSIDENNILCFIGFFSLYNLYLNSKDNLENYRLFTEETTLEEIRKFTSGY